MLDKDLARFWAKVEKTDGCWNWTATAGASGYGHFRLNGHTLAVHRLSYEIEYGPIPEGQCVLHTCDNRRCLRPSHLFLGDRTDNAADRERKGRTLNGESAPNAKLTAAQAHEIRTCGGKGTDVAAKFGVSRATISRIRSGKSRRNEPREMEYEYSSVLKRMTPVQIHRFTRYVYSTPPSWEARETIFDLIIRRLRFHPELTTAARGKLALARCRRMKKGSVRSKATPLRWLVHLTPTCPVWSIIHEIAHLLPMPEEQKKRDAARKAGKYRAYRFHDREFFNNLMLVADVADSLLDEITEVCPDVNLYRGEMETAAAQVADWKRSKTR